MKVLVTGANGLLGQHLIRELLEAGYTVIAAGKGECRLPFSHDYHLQYVKMDLREPFDVYHVFDEHHPDIVVHAGAMTALLPFWFAAKKPGAFLYMFPPILFSTALPVPIARKMKHAR